MSMIDVCGLLFKQIDKPTHSLLFVKRLSVTNNVDKSSHNSFA